MKPAQEYLRDAQNSDVPRMVQGDIYKDAQLCLARGEFDKVNTALSESSVEEIDLGFDVWQSMLRATFAAREKLPAWANLLEGYSLALLASSCAPNYTRSRLKGLHPSVTCTSAEDLDQLQGKRFVEHLALHNIVFTEELYAKLESLVMIVGRLTILGNIFPDRVLVERLCDLSGEEFKELELP